MSSPTRELPDVSMTFAVALEDVALVAAETRVSTMGRYSSGQWWCYPVSDVEPVTHRIGKTQLVIPARQRLMRPLQDGSGWCVATCHQPVGGFCLQELAAHDASDEEGQLRAAQEPLHAYLVHRATAPDSHGPLLDETVECSIARREGNGFAVHHVSVTSGTRERLAVAYGIPPEFWVPDYASTRLPGTATERLDAFARLRAAFESRLMAAVGLGARIRAIAELFRVTYLLCGERGSISDYLEVGVVDAKGDRRALPPTPCGELLASDDATVEGLLEAPLPASSDRLPDDEDWAAWFREGSVSVSPPDAADPRVVLQVVDGAFRWPSREDAETHDAAAVN